MADGKVLVTGVRGQLGYDVMKCLAARGIKAVGVDIEEMDITDEAACKRVIGEAQVAAVIHCAAYTAVDTAEENTALCKRINATGTENIAKVCGEKKIKMMYISTDYIFDGQGERPWEPDDKAKPLNVYGQTKYEGELAVQKYCKQFFIVRISWVFGLNGNNFIKTMLRQTETKTTVSVVNDQFGSPTYTADLAGLLVDMIQSEKYGKYHATNEGICTWYELACEVFRQAGKKMQVIPVLSAEFKSKAKRPTNSRMSKEKLVQNGFGKLPTWQDAVSRYLKEIQ